MTGENECGCRLPCGICMITNRKCTVSTINDLVYNKDDISVGGVHFVDDEYLRQDEKLTKEVKAKMIEEVKAKMNERFGKAQTVHCETSSQKERK